MYTEAFWVGCIREDLQMATLRKARQKYYSRIRWYDENQIQKEKSIPLTTNLKSEALVRKTEVERYEDDIKKGEDYTVHFGWLNDGGKTKIARRTLQEAIDEYHVVKDIRNQRKSTIERSKVGLKTLTDVVGRTCPVGSLTDDDIEDWGKKCNEKGHKPNTQACNRAKIVAFLNHCYRKRWIKNEIYFPRIDNTQTEIKYVNEKIFRKIIALETVAPHFKRAFFFYLSSGCRRAEPFNGDLSDNHLKINCETAKSKTTRYVNLTPLMRATLVEMRVRCDNQIAKYGYKQRSIEMRYTKEFKKACRAIGVEDLHLHNLRNSYIVIRWAVTGDIKAVSEEVGHANIKQTMEYSQIPPLVIADKFPTYKKLITERLKQKESSNTFIKMLEGNFEDESGLRVTPVRVNEPALLT